jgi:hypothetical protein
MSCYHGLSNIIPRLGLSETLVYALSLLAGDISGSLDDPSRFAQSIDLLTCKVYFGHRCTANQGESRRHSVTSNRSDRRRTVYVR